MASTPRPIASRHDPAHHPPGGLGRRASHRPLHGVDAPQFNINRYLRELKQQQTKADQFRLQLKTLLTEQRSLSKRFFATLVQEVIGQKRNRVYAYGAYINILNQETS